MHQYAAAADVELLAHTPRHELRRALEAIALKAASIIEDCDCSVALYQPSRDELITLASSNPKLDTPQTRFRPGDGIAGHVASTREPFLARDVNQEHRFLSLSTRPVGSVLCVPILSSDRQLLGTITAVSPEPGGFGDREQMLLSTIADMAALSIAQLVHAHRLQVLNLLSQRLLASSDLDETFDFLRNALLTLIPLDVLCLQESAPESAASLLWCSDSVTIPFVSPNLALLHVDEPLLLSPHQRDTLLGQESDSGCCNSCVLLPLKASGQLLGHLLVATDRADAYSVEHIQTLDTIASQTALWLKNQTLYERVLAQGERLEAVFGSSSDAIFMLSDDVVTRANPAALHLLGLTEDECVGRRQDELVQVVPVADPDGDKAAVTSIQTRSGTREVEMVRSTAVVEDVSYSILTLRDVTEQRELDRVKASFISMVSHELRTPLNSILGFSDILLTGAAGSINDHQREFLGHIKTSSRHLVQLVNDILDLSRIDAGHFRLDIGPLLPGVLVRQVVAQLSGLAAAAQVELLAEVEENLPPAHGDARRIEQVLINLVGNALKFTPAGGKVRVRVVQGTGKLVFSVIDNGAGIAEEEREKIFERFYQPATTPGLATKGSGLGLTIARHLVEQHQGCIWLESEVGVGSEFYFTLPLTVSRTCPEET